MNTLGQQLTVSDQSQQAVLVAVAAADAKGGENIFALDVAEHFALSDAFILVSGNSERNVQAISDNVEDEMLAAGHRTLRREGRSAGRWVLLDFGDVIVHVFHHEDREYYDLERLWKDCPAMDVSQAITGENGPQVDL